MKQRKLTMLKKLKKWLSKKDNSTTKLAYLMGYKSSSTVTNWITRGSIPSHAEQQLKTLLK